MSQLGTTYKEKPVPVRSSNLLIRLLKHGQRRHNIQQHNLAHPLRKINAQFMRDPCASIVSADVVLVVIEAFHDGGNVACHGGLGVSFVGAVVVGFGGLTVAAQVERDYSVRGG